jgi:hypothetical protein
MLHLDPLGERHEVGLVEHVVDPLTHGERNEVEARVRDLVLLELGLECGPHRAEGGLHHLVRLEREHELQLPVAHHECHLAAVDLNRSRLVEVEQRLPITRLHREIADRRPCLNPLPRHDDPSHTDANTFTAGPSR